MIVRIVAAFFMACVAVSTADASPRARTIAQPLDLADLQTSCRFSILSNCRVASAGVLNDSKGARLIAWQTQTGFTPDQGVLGGVVLFEPAPRNRWTVLSRDVRAFRYGLPRLIEDRMLHVPGRGGGSGAPNADLLFVVDERPGAHPRWRRIDLDKWKDEIAAHVAPGLSILQGVDYDFDDRRHGLTARTPLWRENDANGGPTGGHATIVFRLAEDRLSVESVRPAPAPMQ